MTDADYEYECSRAELLGIPAPSREEFLARRREEAENVEENENDEIKSDEAEELDAQGEKIKRATGGLDELNSILSITQKKINRFKTVCGSFTNLLKLQIGKKEGDASETSSQLSVNVDQNNAEAQEATNQQNGDSGALSEPTKKVGARTSPLKDIDAQVGSQIDRLDSLITKAERADVSLHCQNKQMRSILKK